MLTRYSHRLTKGGQVVSPMTLCHEFEGTKGYSGLKLGLDKDMVCEHRISC